MLLKANTFTKKIKFLITEQRVKQKGSQTQQPQMLN